MFVMFLYFFVRKNEVQCNKMTFSSKMLDSKRYKPWKEGKKIKKYNKINMYKFCYFQFNIVVAFVNASRTKKVFERAKK